MSRRAVSLALRKAQRDSAALFEIPMALWNAFFGNAPEARQSALAALELSTERYVEYSAAFALAVAGDSSRAQTIANDLEWRFNDDTGVRFSYMPAIRARLALNHAEPAKAIELLQIAAPYELGAPRVVPHASLGGLYPIYVRGEAYLAARQDAEAAAEFQKILDHRGIVVSDPIGALAHLQPGRAFVLSRDKAKARLPTRISSPFGKTPSPTSRSSSKPGRNSPGCSSLCITPESGGDPSAPASGHQNLRLYRSIAGSLQRLAERVVFFSRLWVSRSERGSHHLFRKSGVIPAQPLGILSESNWQALQSQDRGAPRLRRPKRTIAAIPIPASAIEAGSGT